MHMAYEKTISASGDCENKDLGVQPAVFTANISLCLVQSDHYWHHHY